MHELALMESVVSAISGQLDDQRVLTVRLEIGRLTCVFPDALRFCFDVCTRGTRLEGSELDIVEVPGRARCDRCQKVHDVAHLGEICPCGNVAMNIVAGQELRLKEVEVI